MVKMSKKDLLHLAGSLDAIDVTYEYERRKGCERFTKVAYSEGKDGVNGFVFKGNDDKIYIISRRTAALWAFGL